MLPNTPFRTSPRIAWPQNLLQMTADSKRRTNTPARTTVDYVWHSSELQDLHLTFLRHKTRFQKSCGFNIFWVRQRKFTTHTEALFDISIIYLCGISQLTQVHKVSGNACFWNSCGNSLLLEKLLLKYWNFKLFSIFNLSSNTYSSLFLVFNKQFSIFDVTLFFTCQQGLAHERIY